jgi:superfamily I DNA/RNA helicase
MIYASLLSIAIFMIGDPKQAIEWTQELHKFTERVKTADYVTMLPINNITRRVPTECLVLSNKFCYPNQLQTSASEIKGKLSYIESNQPSYDDTLNHHIAIDNIVCIDKKQGRYSTKKNSRGCFPYSVDEKIRNSNHGKDDGLIVKAAYEDFCANVNKSGNKIAIDALKKRFLFSLERQEYAQLMSGFGTVNEPTTTIKVSSIDAVKGLDADTCVLILTSNTYKYLMQTTLSPSDKFNKEWKRVYVALTRAKREIMIALDHTVFATHDISTIKADIESLGFIQIN